MKTQHCLIICNLYRTDDPHQNKRQINNLLVLFHWYLILYIPVFSNFNEQVLRLINWFPCFQFKINSRKFERKAFNLTKSTVWCETFPRKYLQINNYLLLNFTGTSEGSKTTESTTVLIATSGYVNRYLLNCAQPSSSLKQPECSIKSSHDCLTWAATSSARLGSVAVTGNHRTTRH